MSKDTLYSLTQTAGVYDTTQITDELYTDVGASAIQMGTVKRLFLGGTDFVINTAAAGAGTELVEGVDYDIVEEDFDYTTEIGFHVYTGIDITNVAYQSGDLYFTYKTYGSYTDPTALASRAELLTPPTVYKSTSYTITDSDGYYRIESNQSTADITITLPVRANNIKRRIEIVNSSPSTTYKLIISSTASDISNDGFTSIYLPKKGNFLILQENTTSSYWEIVNEKITSQFRLDGYKGYGSVDTKIMQFTNVIENIGNMFSENHVSGYNSTTEGLKITVNKSGWYSFNFIYTPNGVADSALSLNSTQLTTSAATILHERKISAVTAPADNHSVCNSVNIYLNKNDIVRPHTSGTVSYSSRASFMATYLGI